MSRDTAISILIDEDAPATAAPEAGAPEELVGVVDETPVEGLPKGARLNANGTVILPLATPVSLQVKRDGKVTSVTYDALTFRRFNGADLRAIRNVSGDAQTVEMFVRATGVPPKHMGVLYDRMDVYDTARAGEVIEYFFKNGPMTGR